MERAQKKGRASQELVQRDLKNIVNRVQKFVLRRSRAGIEAVSIYNQKVKPAGNTSASLTYISSSDNIITKSDH